MRVKFCPNLDKALFSRKTNLTLWANIFWAAGAVLIIGIIILVVAVGGFWAKSYNSLVGLKQNVDAKWAEVENQYERRADLIPNLVQTVSGAANFEKSTLIAVTDARASVGQVKIDPSQAPTDPAQLQKYEAAQGQLGNALCPGCWLSRKITHP